MTAPVVAELRRRRPDLRLTIQSGVDVGFLRSRYDDFDHIPEIADFGFRMFSATGIDLEASARDYAALLARFDDEVAANMAMMERAPPDLVLSNVAFVPLAAAARLGIPAYGLSCINWADMVRHYLGGRPEIPALLDRVQAAYESARAFLRCTPSQTMTLANQRGIGAVARVGRRAADSLRNALGRAGDKVGLIAFGGIDHDIDLNCWPRLDGWVWLTTQASPPGRADMVRWQQSGLDFSDLMASVDVVVTKPGYGTFTEAGMVGTPVLYTERPDWPESPHLDNWLAAHTQALGVAPARLLDGSLPDLLQKLFSLPRQQVAQPEGVSQAAEILLAHLGGLA